MKFSTKNINVGDKVICYSGGMGTERIGTVVKKTPSGLIDVSFGHYKERFRKNGSEQKESIWNHKWLDYYTDEKGSQIEEESRIKGLAYKISECKFRDFSIEALDLIWAICEKEIQRNEAE